MTLARDVHVRASRSDRPSAAVVALVRPAMAPCRARGTGGGDPVDLTWLPPRTRKRLVPSPRRSLVALRCPPRLAHSRPLAPG